MRDDNYLYLILHTYLFYLHVYIQNGLKCIRFVFVKLKATTKLTFSFKPKQYTLHWYP